jgi:hypothetical protein
MRAAVLTSAALALSACAGSTAPSLPDHLQVHFACTDGSALDVTFSGHLATVRRGGERFELPQTISGSGFWYMDARHSLRGKGQEVQWSIGRMAPLTCRAE